MILGGFQKNTLIDFPRTIACIVFTQGCNFFCPYCHNPDLVAGPQKAGSRFETAEFFSFLEKRKGMLQGVVITGGEPTLQKDLISFCYKIKEMGYKLKLDTNGTRPGVVAQILDEGLADFISMDIKTSLESYHLVAPKTVDPQKILDTAHLLMEQAPDYEFRTTCSRPFISLSIMEEIGKMIQGAKQYILQNCSRNITVLDPEFLNSDAAFFSDGQMHELKAILEHHVPNTVIR